jgi:hypothetical protein
MRNIFARDLPYGAMEFESVDPAIAKSGKIRCVRLGVTHREGCFFGGSAVAASGPLTVGVAGCRTYAWWTDAGSVFFRQQDHTPYEASTTNSMGIWLGGAVEVRKALSK